MDRTIVLVLGGTGVFGSRICRKLARDPHIAIVIGGRNGQKARAVHRAIVDEVPDPVVSSLMIAVPEELPAALDQTGARIVVHTCGPFQGQDYRVADLCIERGVHYIDLSDGRKFVEDFGQLNDVAESADVLAVSGASSVPGLSSTVVAELRKGMARVEEIAIGILPGYRQPRGRAVVEAILGTVGQPLSLWRNGRWEQAYGWQDMRRRSLTVPGLRPIPARWLALCDVPDLGLFPEREADLRTVTFHAGLEVAMVHLGLWALSWPARFGLVRSWARYAGFFMALSSLFTPFGSDRGGMFVKLRGMDAEGAPVRRAWTVVAEQGDGPWIPTIPAVILTKKLARGEVAIRGAVPCLELFSLEDFDRETADLAISWAVS